MYYKISSKGQARTKGYVGSTNNPYDSDVEAIREDIRRHNKQLQADHEKYGKVYGQFMKLRVRARGPRRKYSYDTLLKDARYFDVYKSEDTTRTWLFKHSLK